MRDSCVSNVLEDSDLIQHKTSVGLQKIAVARRAVKPGSTQGLQEGANMRTVWPVIT